jgi:hypothetical protein
MSPRQSVGLSSLDLLSARIVDGSFPNRPGCSLEISSYVWNQNSFGSQQHFEDLCQEHGITFSVVERIGGIEWACPEGQE